MIYRFDAFEIDTEAFELRADGAVRKVEPMVFDLLVFFARNPGRVIGRDEMIEDVWGGRIVSDATISSCVKSARRALGDSGERQGYLQTVRGRGFRFAAEIHGGETSTERTAVSAVRPASGSTLPVLVVLPFDNLSGEVDAYFADGLIGDIITNLSRFRDLRVIARATSFRFRQAPEDLSEFCDRIGAGYAVEGSVRRAGDRVRISAQLIEAATGLHLWAESYDREMEDIFALQDEVTRTIAATLGVKIQDVALQQSLRKSAAELDAYDCVLRARRFTSLLSPDSHAEARDLLESAIALDPTSADAHALLANVYLSEYRFGTNPRPGSVDRALAMAQTAVALDQQNAYARCWLATVHFFRGEDDLFETEAQRAIDLNPNDPETLADIGHFLAFKGEYERGVALSERARGLNPLHPGWYHFTTARHLLAQRKFKEVLAVAQRISMPSFYWTHILNAVALGHLGRPEAEQSLARIFALKPSFSAEDEFRVWRTTEDDFRLLMEGLGKAGLEGVTPF